MHRVYYHGSDFDGWACAAIYALRKQKVELNPVEYGQEINFDNLENHDVVAILDFCPDAPNVIREVMEKVPVFYWIDHHKTSREMYEKEDFKLIHTPPGQFITDSEDNPMAACELLYMFLHDVEYKDIPYYIRLLGRFDVWRHEDPQTLPFQYAMKAWLGEPRKNLQQWKKLLRPSKSDHKLFQKLIEAGKYIMMYESNKNKEIAEKLCFEMEFEGYRTLAINRTMESSKFFESIYNPKIHDLMLQFGYWDGKWILSFISDKKDVDCSVIAKKYGGGGHRSASGSVVKELPKEIKDKLCL